MHNVLAWLKDLRSGVSHAPSNCCGVALQDKQLVAVQIAPASRHRPVILNYAVLPAASGVDSQTLQQVARCIDLSRTELRYVLASHQYRLQLIELPPVPDGELKQALGWRLPELFADHHDQQEPSSSNFTFDVLPLPSTQFNKPPSQALVFGLSNRALQPLQMAFHAASLPIDVVDVAALAQRNLSALAEPDGRGLAVLSFHENGGLLTITQGGELYLVRHFETSLTQLMRADDEGRNLLLERVALDVQRSFDVFDRQYQTVNLSRLLIAPMPLLPGLLPSLQQNLFVPVDWFDLDSLFDLPDEVHTWLLWSALGAALRPLGDAA
jgi:MSHA biogenesis protein MshI